MARKDDEQFYRVKNEPGTHLSDSTKTDGNKRALLFDENGKLKGPPELEPVDPEELEPSTLSQLKYDLGVQVIQELPNIWRAGKELYQDHKIYKERQKQREHELQMQQLRQKQIEDERKLAEIRQREEEQEKREKIEAARSVEQKQVINLTDVLNKSYSNFKNHMTETEACKTLINAFLYFVLGMREIFKFQNTDIIDDEGNIISVSDWLNGQPIAEILQYVNMLLKANPQWLEGYQEAMLSAMLGRSIIIDNVYNPMTGEDVVKMLVGAKEN